MKTEKYKGFTILISNHEDAESPRGWDNTGTISVTKNCRYKLGDEEYSDPMDFLANLSGKEFEELEQAWKKEANELEFPQWVLSKARETNIILPVFLYDHSGISVSTTPFSCHWDSGLIGFIHVSHKDIMKTTGHTELTAEDIEEYTTYLENEIKTLDDYCRGYVYQFLIEDPEGEVIDSCGGYYGDEGIQIIIDECHETIDTEVARLRKVRDQKLKTWIRNHVPYEVRATNLASMCIINNPT